MAAVEVIPQMEKDVSKNSYALRKRSVVKIEELSVDDHEQPLSGESLSFYHRYFTKPVAADASQRRFSVLAIGSLVTLIGMLLVLSGIVAVAAAVTSLVRRQQQQGTVLQSGPINLAIMANFADPAIWLVNGTWYAYATIGNAGVLPQQRNAVQPGQAVEGVDYANIQMALSTDFQTWNISSPVDDPLPTVGLWARQSNGATNASQANRSASTWAPGIIQRDDGKYVLYYSAVVAPALGNPHPSHNRPHCIGAAVGSSPQGPFAPSDDYITCPMDAGGAIDAEAIKDADGEIYVVWKIDGNNIGNGGDCGNTVAPIVPTPIMLQKMSSDGITPAGEAVQILDRIEEDGPLVEAPMLIRSSEGVYFLFYSSGCTRLPTYNVRYATAKNITGPYVRAAEPLLQTGSYGLEAPGSVGITQDLTGAWRMAFHARTDDGTVGKVRAMYTTGLSLQGENASLVSA